jgi:hypothetical protein
MRRVAVVFAFLMACGASSGSGTGTGTGSGYAPAGHKPVNARRPTPPPGIAASALAVGAEAPNLTLPSDLGRNWLLADALQKHARVMLVFYRGDW